MIFTGFIVISLFLSSLVFGVRKKPVTLICSLLYLVLLTGLTYWSGQHIGQFDSIYFLFDKTGLLFALILVILSITTFYHSRAYLKRHEFSPKRETAYYALLILLITAIMCAYFAENMAVFWVCVETTTLLITFLVYQERTRESVEAAWKYLFVSSIGLALAFIGLLLLNIAASNSSAEYTNGLSLSHLISIASTLNPVWLKLAFLLILTGYSAKMGLFPLHPVTVDAKTFAPTPISALISTTLVNVGFLGIFRFYLVLAQTETLRWVQHVLLIAGTLSVFMAAIQLQRIKNFKRMFAFSSMEHMGLAAIGLGVGGIGYYAAILHLVFHSFYKAGLFYQIAQVFRFYRSYWIDDCRGYFKYDPIGGLAMIFGLISILAIPPSGLFITEFMFFKALFTAHYYILAVFLLILLTLIIYTFSKNILNLLYGADDGQTIYPPKTGSIYDALPQFILFGLVIYLSINPPHILTDMIQQAIAILN